MPRHPSLTFANLASATALVIATTGGGFAVAAGLDKNVVGSAQIKTGAVKSADIKNGGVKGKDVKDDSLTGKDVKESTLGSVPSVDSVATRTVSAAAGQTKAIYTKGTFIVELECTAVGGGEVRATVNLRTTADNAFMDANDEGAEYSDFDVATGPADIVSDADTVGTDGEDGSFAALSASGLALTGHAFALAKVGGTDTCTGGGSFIS